MGVGRKEFLRLIGLALVGLTIDPLKAVAVNDDAYVNKKLGILFYKPKDWAFVAVKDFGKLKSAQIIGEGFEKTPDQIWNELGDPVCVITKYFEDKPELKGIFSPTITLNITHKSELEDLGIDTFEELMQMSHYGTSQILKDFKIIKSYEPYTISNCMFYEFDAEYMFEHIEIESPLKVELKVLKCEHNDFYYDFNLHQSKSQNQSADKEFKNFISTIKLI